MATTNNVIIANVAAATTANSFNIVWRLTRALLKAGWKKTGSSDGTTLSTGDDPLTDRWAQTFGQIGQSATTSGTTSVTAAAASRGRAVISGLTGITSAMKGSFLVFSSGVNSGKAFQIEAIDSATQVQVDARRANVTYTSHASTSVSWAVRSPTTDVTQPAGLTANAAWWSAIGPSTVKVQLNAAPTGTFIRGENVVQATSGAEGELIGIVWDATLATGYAVIAPRVRGVTSPDTAYGWQTNLVVTGALSGATFTSHASTAAVEYRQEIVLWKNGTSSLTSGSIFHGTFDPVADDAAAETAWTFRKKASGSSAGVTAVVAPGGGGTNNTFPFHGWVSLGTNTTGTGSLWFSGTLAYGQIGCADCIEESGYSMDGSFFVMTNNTAITGGAYTGHALCRLDDTEEGDVSPYVSQSQGLTETLGNNPATRTGGALATVSDIYCASPATGGALLKASTTEVYYKGWRARASETATTAASFINYEAAQLRGLQTAQNIGATTATTPMRTPNDPAALRKVREPIWMLSLTTAIKHLKGTLRWQYSVQGGNGGDVYDSMYVQGSVIGSPSVIQGPWDSTAVLLS
jgi:hypothetical protein